MANNLVLRITAVISNIRNRNKLLKPILFRLKKKLANKNIKELKDC